MDHFFNLFPTAAGLVAEANSSMDIQLIVAAFLILMSGVSGLAVGYLLGQRTGKLAGELETLKSMRRGKSSRAQRPSSGTSNPANSNEDESED